MQNVLGITDYKKGTNFLRKHQIGLALKSYGIGLAKNIGMVSGLLALEDVVAAPLLRRQSILARTFRNREEQSLLRSFLTRRYNLLAQEEGGIEMGINEPDLRERILQYFEEPDLLRARFPLHERNALTMQLLQQTHEGLYRIEFDTLPGSLGVINRADIRVELLSLLRTQPIIDRYELAGNFLQHRLRQVIPNEESFQTVLQYIQGHTTISRGQSPGVYTQYLPGWLGLRTETFLEREDEGFVIRPPFHDIPLRFLFIQSRRWLGGRDQMIILTEYRQNRQFREFLDELPDANEIPQPLEQELNHSFAFFRNKIQRLRQIIIESPDRHNFLSIV